MKQFCKMVPLKGFLNIYPESGLKQIRVRLKGSIKVLTYIHLNKY
jgi:hypothetical protein